MDDHASLPCDRACPGALDPSPGCTNLSSPPYVACGFPASSLQAPQCPPILHSEMCLFSPQQSPESPFLPVAHGLSLSHQVHTSPPTPETLLLFRPKQPLISKGALFLLCTPSLLPRMPTSCLPLLRQMPVPTHSDTILRTQPSSLLQKAIPSVPAWAVSLLLGMLVTQYVTTLFSC